MTGLSLKGRTQGRERERRVSDRLTMHLSREYWPLPFPSAHQNQDRESRSHGGDLPTGMILSREGKVFSKTGAEKDLRMFHD